MTQQAAKTADTATDTSPENTSMTNEAPSSPEEVDIPDESGLREARFPEDPNDLFPDDYAGLTKNTKPDGKIEYTVECGNTRYKVEYHPKHEGNPGEHFDGAHYHVKKESAFPPPGKTSNVWFRVKNYDPDTPAILGGGTFAPGDLLPTKNGGP